MDADGVALAAIQGLNQKLEEQLREKDARITQLERKAATADSLEKRLAELETLVGALQQTHQERSRL